MHMLPNGPDVRRRPQKYQETWRVVSGVRTSRLLGIAISGRPELSFSEPVFLETHSSPKNQGDMPY